MAAFFQDLRYGARSLLKTPGFTLAAIAALALGIGANTAIFSIVDALIFQALRFPGGDRVVMLWERGLEEGTVNSSTSVPVVLEWAARTDTFEAVGGFFTVDANLTGVDEPTRLAGVRTTAGLFSATGATALYGRTFSAEEDTWGAPPVTVLSHAVWRSHFGGDPAVVGRTASINGKAHTIIGVLPERYDFPPGAELYLPMAPSPEEREEWGLRRARTVALLKDGVSPAAAQAVVSSIAEALRARDPERMNYRGFHLTTVQEGYDQAHGGVTALAAAVLLLLLIACVNVANLLLVRGAIRSREFAVRAALGAGRGRLLRQLFAESLILSLTGCALGSLLAVWGVDALAAATSWMRGLAGWKDIGVDLRALGFGVALSVVTAFLFGLLPALRASRPQLADALKDGARGSGGGARLRSMLVAIEIALALVLLAGAGLLMKSFVRAQTAQFGFDPSGVVSMRVGLSEARFPESEDRVRYVNAVVERLGTLPGAVVVGAMSKAPMSPGNRTSSVSIIGRPPPPAGERPIAEFRTVAGPVFAALKIPLIAGRVLTASDDERAPLVGVVSLSFAQQHFGGAEAAVGQRFEYGGDPVEIVGVVGDTLRVGSGKPRPAMAAFYVPYAQDPEGGISFFVRAPAAGALIPSVRSELRAVDPHQPVFALQTYEDALAEAYTPLRLLTALLGLFALISAILAGVGIYGVMAYSVAQRTREIGVRVALGAARPNIYRLVLGDAGRIAAWGIGLGGAAALGLAQVARGLLYETSPADPSVFTAICAGVLALALLASWIPARRAASVAPMVALKSE